MTMSDLLLNGHLMNGGNNSQSSADHHLNVKSENVEPPITSSSPGASAAAAAAAAAKSLINMEKIENDRLISAVKESPFLYDTSHRDYKDTGIKQAAWEAIAAQFDVTPVECQTRWKNLRDRYTRERQRMSKGLIEYSKWRLFNTLDFLYPFLHQRTRSELKFDSANAAALNLSSNGSATGVSMVTCSQTPPIGQPSSQHSDSHSGSPSVDNDIDSNSDRDSVHDHHQHHSKPHSFNAAAAAAANNNNTLTADTPGSGGHALNYSTHTPNAHGIMTPVAKRARPASMMPDHTAANTLSATNSLLNSLTNGLGLSQLPDLSQLLASMSAVNTTSAAPLPLPNVLAGLNSETLASMRNMLAQGSLSTPPLQLPCTSASPVCPPLPVPLATTTTTTSSANGNTTNDPSSTTTTSTNAAGIPTFNGIENSLAQLLQDEDEDIHFALSVGYQLRKFNGQARALAKLKIQQVLYDVEYGVPSTGLPIVSSSQPPSAHANSNSAVTPTSTPAAAAGALLSLSTGSASSTTNPTTVSLSQKTSGLLTAAALAKELMHNGQLPTPLPPHN